MNAIDYINEHIDGRRILEYYEFENITESESYIRCCCKIHNGNNPTSFCWNKENNLWICYTGDCGGGDAYTLVEKIENKSFLEAVKKVSYILGLDIGDKDIVEPADRIKNENKRWLNKQLKKTKHSEIKEYEISYTKYYTTLRGFDRFDEKTLEFYDAKFCKLYPIKDNILYNKLVIPLYFNNKTIGVALRDTTGIYKPKWFYDPKCVPIGNTLYNYDRVLNMVKHGEINEVILVEGIFDVWAYHKIGLDNVVAIFGSSLSEEQFKLLVKLGVNIVTSFDNDNAGNKCTKKVIERFKNISDIYCVVLPDGNDPDDTPNLLEHYTNRIKYGSGLY